MNFALAITLLRFLLAPPMVWLLLRGEFAAALLLFLIASLSDALDGYIARHYNQRTALGALLDPLADKLLVACAILTLGWLGLFPLWLMAVILLRDLVIVGGAAVYRKLTGELEMAPIFISKLNTAVQLTLVLAIMATASGLAWLAWAPPILVWLTLLTTVASGAEYVRIWSRRAQAALKA